MANKFSRRSITSVHITSKHIQDELLKPKNITFQTQAARHIRNTQYRPAVERFYGEMLDTITDYFTDPREAPDGGSSFSAPFQTISGIPAPHRQWRALSKPYIKSKRTRQFLHNTGALAKGMARLFPKPKGRAIRSTGTIRIGSRSKRSFRAGVSVYIAHKLGDPSLTDYVNRAFTRGAIHANKFHGSGDQNLGKLVMFETGRKGGFAKGGGHTSYARNRLSNQRNKRPIIGPIAKAVGIHMRKVGFGSRSFK